ncbi:PepSY domain-containing protein [Xanthomonas oryzae pv. oryzicola]|nr:PepSY domain-containing protein [Xanthomonas oryzae pv. oryzicola]WGY42849.1 PepSY domain-containing protein [Xanthomonas oryzae pv. oryzicola]
MAPKIPSGPADLQLADVARRDRHRLFWRWHLYAGLFVAPFLLMLAVTGAIYLFNLSGLYLGWPRGQGHAGWHGLVPTARAKGRAFWKSLQPATGPWICLLVLFLIFTGLPWATSWGAWVRSGAEMIDAGYPAVYRRYVAPAAPTVGTEFNDVPWTLQHAPMPPAATGSDTAHSHHLPHCAATPGAARDWTDAGLERAIAHIRAAGTADPLQVFLPSTQRGALMVSTSPDQPQGQVTYHFDQQGALLVRAGFDDDGAVAQAIEMGVQLHMGNYVGRANQFVILFACVGIVVLCASGMVMWCGGPSRPHRRARSGPPHAASLVTRLGRRNRHRAPTAVLFTSCGLNVRPPDQAAITAVPMARPIHAGVCIARLPGIPGAWLPTYWSNKHETTRPPVAVCDRPVGHGRSGLGCRSRAGTVLVARPALCQQRPRTGDRHSHDGDPSRSPSQGLRGQSQRQGKGLPGIGKHLVGRYPGQRVAL